MLHGFYMSFTTMNEFYALRYICNFQYNILFLFLLGKCNQLSFVHVFWKSFFFLRVKNTWVKNLVVTICSIYYIYLWFLTCLYIYMKICNLWIYKNNVTDINNLIIRNLPIFKHFTWKSLMSCMSHTYLFYHNWKIYFDYIFILLSFEYRF